LPGRQRVSPGARAKVEQEEAGVADEATKLLRYIVRQHLARQDAVDIEREATAVDRGLDLANDVRRAIRDEEQRAEELSDAFREGLVRADAARRAGGNAISLDDRREEDNRQADALIQFLVRTDLASSTTRETEPHHYIYKISVDWDALNRLAQGARVNLDALLGRNG
jgi:hypothetical protein